MIRPRSARSSSRKAPGPETQRGADAETWRRKDVGARAALGHFFTNRNPFYDHHSTTGTLTATCAGATDVVAGNLAAPSRSPTPSPRQPRPYLATPSHIVSASAEMASGFARFTTALSSWLSKLMEGACSSPVEAQRPAVLLRGVRLTSRPVAGRSSSFASVGSALRLGCASMLMGCFCGRPCRGGVSSTGGSGPVPSPSL